MWQQTVNVFLYMFLIKIFLWFHENNNVKMFYELVAILNMILPYDSFRLQFLKSCVRLHGLCIEIAMVKSHSYILKISNALLVKPVNFAD